MVPEAASEVLSSRVKLRILDAVAIRPRTLGELSSLTGISVQGVLRHLKRLMELRLVEERRLQRVAPKARLVYAATSTTFRDFSSGELILVKSSELHPRAKESPRIQDLERAAGDILIRRRRILDGARRLGRLIDDLADDEASLSGAVTKMNLSPRERLLVEVALTEETLKDGAKVLSEFYGLSDTRSIETALAKARQSV